jgi:outer membrane protein assembly factor BamB
LDIIWKHHLGSGKTVISWKGGERIWSGCGWTGQPLLVREHDRLFLIQGAYDHHLKKLDADSGTCIWEYAFDDVLKGTGTIWKNFRTENMEESLLILQGSRRGVENSWASDHVPSFRAISYFTGRELWRLDVKQTRSYSRDTDASALVLDDTAYIGLENAYFTVFDPNPQTASIRDSMLQPHIMQEILLYTEEDAKRHGNNLVVESSPSLLMDHIYVTAGSGHVFGYNLTTHQIDWDFFIGSDLDGSPVVTEDSCLLVTVEKQHIQGRGGLFKLNPRKPESEAVVWYFPTNNVTVSEWEGGVVGSACINDRTRKAGDPYLAAVIGIDGFLYVIDYKKLDPAKEKVTGPNNEEQYDTPVLIYKTRIGPSISTPIIVGNKLIAAGYNGISLFEFDANLQFTLLDRKSDSIFEATPIAYRNRIYVGSRDGYLYCFGESIPD